MGLLKRINKIIVKIIKYYLLILEEEKKKTTFLFVFLIYLLVFLLKFRSGELIGCRIQFFIQRVPTRHTFDGPPYHKNKKYIKNVMMTSSFHFFRYFLFLGQRGPSKVCRVGTRWMQNLILHPTSSPDRNLSKNTGIYVKNTNKKVVFFFSSSKINKYYFIILTIILVVHFRRPILS